MRDELRRALEESRAVTLRLVAGLSEEEARNRAHPAFSPVGWHLGHVAWQEELFVLRRSAGHAPIEPAFDAIFDSFVSRKDSRGSRIPPLREIFDYQLRVRERTLRLLERTSFEEELLRDGWAFRFAANHERQHAETLAVVRLLAGARLDGPPHPKPAAFEPVWEPRLPFDGGQAFVGTDEDPDRWDNESRAHRVELRPFLLAPAPVTCAAWLEFMAEGGYEDRRLWSEEGFAFVRRFGIASPLHWERDGEGAWVRRTLRGPRPLRGDEPVAHVSFHEAEAFARFAGARLPDEREWEAAASRDGAHRRRFAWGDDPAAGQAENLGARELDVRPCGGGAPAPCGAGDMAGQVWEWTASDFSPWPDFEPGPYRGYSEPWFGRAHRVLRGGSHLTQIEIARTTFRNFLEPSTRAYPTGLRLFSDRA